MIARPLVRCQYQVLSYEGGANRDLLVLENPISWSAWYMEEAMILWCQEESLERGIGLVLIFNCSIILYLSYEIESNSGYADRIFLTMDLHSSI